MRKRHDNDDGDNGWKELGGYMHAKIQKLQNQYKAQEPKLADNEKVTGIFKGVAIYVNGLTDPSADELRRLMTVHGGVYHDYQTHATTHVIATNLANSKIKNFSKRNTVVTPKWIVDSIAAGKLLPHLPYLLYSQAYKNQHTINFDTNLKTETTTSKQTAVDAKDSRFLSEFYDHSRLHLISTLAAELKRHVGILRNQSDGSFKGYERIDQWRSNFTGNDILDIQNVENGPVVMHIDMDCFFVSVGLRTRPELIGKPVAVTHSRGVGSSTNTNSEVRKYEKEYYRQNRMINSKQSLPKEIVRQKENDEEANGCASSVEKENGTFLSCSEVASCSYEARKCGICNGMFLGEAKSLCPDLHLIPYDFDGYREVAYTLYNTVASYTLNIEAVSCDELYVDCTELLKDLQISPLAFAKILRDEIKEKTGCCSSTGLAPNMLLARLATRKAKPNGQFYVESDQIESFLAEQSVSNIPGVGWSLSSRLNAIGIKLCRDLQKISFLTLQSEFGVKTGQMLYEMCRGIDGRQIKTDQTRKSVSADVNYGIRFTQVEEANKFLNELSEEVAKRLFEVGKVGKTITLKLKVRKKGAPTESSKFMGHGICDSTSRSVSLKSATNDPKLIARQVQNLLLSFKTRVSDLRGIGIQVQRLEAASNNSTNLLKYLQQPETGKINAFLNVETETKKRISLPPPSEVDLEFLSELPDEFRAQICNEYEEQGMKLDSLPEPKSTLNLMNSLNQIETVSAPHEMDDADQNQSVKVSLCKVTHVDDVKKLINEWIATCSNPGAEDTQTISIYLKELVADKNLERVYTIMKLLRRLVLKNSNNGWMTAFQIILSEVQSFMISVYGAPLKL